MCLYLGAWKSHQEPEGDQASNSFQFPLTQNLQGNNVLKDGGSEAVLLLT